MILVLGSAANEQHDDENVFNENNSERMKYFFFQIEMLKSWEGDMKKLGNAERFLLQLIDVKK